MTKYILYGGAVTIAVLLSYLLWFYPLYAASMLLGAVGAGIYIELLSAWSKSKKAKTTPENEWTGI